MASCDGRTFTLEIADQGKGIPTGSLKEWALASMRERVRLLKGELEIKTSPTGTTITVRLPMAEMASSQAPQPSALPVLRRQNHVTT